METIHQSLSEFSRHIPKILRQQLLCELVHQYLSEKKLTLPSVKTEETQPAASTSNTPSNPYRCQPSIQRFHGALLFVDISGFTALSLKLDVDSLKNHINNYFSKMLDIVEKWDGDVIKFAGDALFIIWPTDIHSKELKLQAGKGGAEGGGRETIRSVNIGHENSAGATFLAATKSALEKAVACGIEITIVCGHHEIYLGASSFDQSEQKKNDSLLGKFLPTWMLNAASTAPKISPESQSENVAYLDVHAGVSLGLMAGVDIGHLDRWEFFLVGDPISRAAEAESQAEKGEVVLCQRAHRLLHRPDKALTAIPAGEEMDFVSLRAPVSLHKSFINQNSPLQCGCTRTKGGLYCIGNIDVKSPKEKDPKLRRGRSKSKVDDFSLFNETNQKKIKFVEDLAQEFDKVYFTISSTILKRKFWSIIEEKTDKDGGDKLTKRVPIPLNRGGGSAERDAMFQRLSRTAFKYHFGGVIKSAILEDVARHVHEVARNDFQFDEITHHSDTFHEFILSHLSNQIIQGSGEEKIKPERTKIDLSSFEMSLTEWLASQDGAAQVEETVGEVSLNSPTTFRSSITSFNSVTSRNGDAADILNSSIEAKAKVKSPSKNRNNDKKRSSLQFISAEATSPSELRSVTVLFIKIDAFDLSLMIDASQKTRGFKKPQSPVYDAFRFLDRTENELTADLVLLQKLQRCIEVVITALHNYKGQLRQFIVDDKGTVAIGTFGLKGSVGNDNAAAALEAARTIIDGIKGLELSVSIGITTGKGYCGFVGSLHRHEYAVMGPSTNLSARLMGKASANEVICDIETKNRDRAHQFEQLQEVTAKGYSQPVMTFKPMFEESVHQTPLQSRPMLNQKSKSPSRYNLIREPSRGRTQFFNILSDDTFEEEYHGNSMIKQLASSDFYVSNNNILPFGKEVQKISTGMGKQLKLYGRQLEILQIFNALFPLNTEGINHTIFNLNQKATMAAICGAGGSGKTALLTAVGQKLFAFSRREMIYHNILVLQNRASSLHSKSSFHTWRPLFTDLLKAVGTAAVAPSNNKRSVRMGSRSTDLTSVLDLFFSEPAVKDYIKLRGYFLLLMGFNSKETEGKTIPEYSGNFKENEQKSAELLIHFIDYCRKKLGKLLCFLIEEVQSLDSWSLVVLHQLWLRTPGIAILVSYSTAQSKELESWSFDGYDLPPVPEANNNDNQKQITYEFFRRYNDDLRFKAIYLFPLDRNATIQLLQESFELDESYEEELQNIYTVSGGNPLYAVELMKSFLSKGISSEPAAFGTDEKDKLKSNAVQAKSTSTLHHRIEEIICFRLDTLESTFQIILKAASVAVSNDRPFTLSLLTFILLESSEITSSDTMLNSPEGVADESRDGNANDPITETIAYALIEMLKSEAFIQLVMPTMNATESASPFQSNHDQTLLLTEELILSSSFEFQIPVEQATIYSLLVDEQKEYFHHRVGLFWERTFIENHQQTRSSNPQNIPHYTDEMKIQYRLEEAHHWERASYWPKAISSYVEVAELMKRGTGFNELSWIVVMKSAMRCYRALEREYEFKIKPTSLEEEQLNLKYLHQLTLARENDASIDYQPIADTLESDVDSIRDMLGDEIDILPALSRMLLGMVDIYGKELDDPDMIEQLLQITLKYYLVSLYYQSRSALPSGSLPLPVNENVKERREEEGFQEMKRESSVTDQITAAVPRLSISVENNADAVPVMRGLKALTITDAMHFFMSYILFGCTVRSSSSRIIKLTIAQRLTKSIYEHFKELVNKKELKSLLYSYANDETRVVQAIDLQWKSCELLLACQEWSWSNSNSETINLLVTELTAQHSQRSFAQSILFYQLFNGDSIPIILQIAQQRLLAQGRLSNYLTNLPGITLPSLTNIFSKNNPSPSPESKKSDQPLLSMTIGSEIMMQLPYQLLFQQRLKKEGGGLSSMWFDYYQFLIQEEKILRIFPYQWKRCIDSWIKEVDFCNTAYFLPVEIEGEESLSASRFVAAFSSKNKSFLALTVSQRRLGLGAAKRNSSMFFRFGGSHRSGKDKKNSLFTVGVTRYDYRRRSAYFVGSIVNVTESESSAKKDLTKNQISIVPSYHLNKYLAQHSLSIESMHAQIILCRLFQLLNEPKTEGDKDTSALQSNDLNQERAELEQDFMFYWHYLLLQCRNQFSRSSEDMSNAAPHYNLMNLLLPIRLILEELNFQIRTLFPSANNSPDHSEQHKPTNFSLIPFISSSQFWSDLSSSIQDDLFPFLKSCSDQQPVFHQNLLLFALLVESIIQVKAKVQVLSSNSVPPTTTSQQEEIFPILLDLIEFHQSLQSLLSTHFQDTQFSTILSQLSSSYH